MHGEECHVEQREGLLQVLVLRRNELPSPCVTLLFLLMGKGKNVPEAKRKGHL